MIDLGFETIGNATLVCHDRGPVLATDPWLGGETYFGSWSLSHEVPEEQQASIDAAPFTWVSHGHPDHLHLPSLGALKGTRTLLVADHVGGRIARSLRDAGFRVFILRDRHWYRISPRIRIMTIADYTQDAVLLVDIDGHLVVNLNDASPRGQLGLLRRAIRAARRSYLLALLRLPGYTDADMTNVFDEDGTRLALGQVPRARIGAIIEDELRRFGADVFVPFSSMHTYGRTDSAWANEHLPSLADYTDGFTGADGRSIFPAFVRYDVAREDLVPLDAVPVGLRLRSPAECGDDWNEELDARDWRDLTRYFTAIEHLGEQFDYLRFVVGGREHVVPLSRKRRNRAITFEAPRASLMKAVRNQIFDDLLIANFVRTTLHGAGWDPPRRAGQSPLSRHFSAYVGRYADNGGVRTRAELRRYFLAYLRRAPIGVSVDLLERRYPTLARIRAAMAGDG